MYSFTRKQVVKPQFGNMKQT